VSASCDFHEPYFGANYPDACCIDGFLWDLDSCDVPGGSLSSGGDVPCPQCQHASWLETFQDEVEMEGWEAFEKKAARSAPTFKAVRHQQPEDHAKMAVWWLKGWDDAQKHEEEQSFKRWEASKQPDWQSTPPAVSGERGMA
jgi:hypothetical protein